MIGCMAVGRSKKRRTCTAAGSAGGPGGGTRETAEGPVPRIDYRTLFEHAPDAILVADAQGRCIGANDAACKLTGYSRRELLKMRVSDLTVASERKTAAGRVDALFEVGRSSRLATLLRKDGTHRTVECSATDLGNDSIHFLRDMSDHCEMVDKLNEVLQRLSFHIERMPLAYVVWNVDFRVEEWNPTAERIFGYSKAEAIGKHAYDLIVPADVTRAVDVVWEKLLKGDASSHSINDNVRKNGTRLTCEWFNTPLRDSSGDIRGVASMAMDITEREAVGEQLRSAQRLESLGVLASGVAHDFNSSLMVILGNTTLLRGVQGLPAEAFEYIKPIESAGSRANELIKHLLAYARTGRHNPHLTDLNAVIKDTMGFVHASIGKQYELDVRLANRLPTILADRSQIEQILLNLCLNAKQAMGARGMIGIATRRVNLTQKRVVRCIPHDGRPGPHVELVVSDAGCGMDDTTVDRIFDPFFTTKTEGHGLGLASVLGILRQHNATAFVDSKLGKGTKIHVFFPVHEGDGGVEGKPVRRRRRTSEAYRRRGSRKS